MVTGDTRIAGDMTVGMMIDVADTMIGIGSLLFVAKIFVNKFNKK